MKKYDTIIIGGGLAGSVLGYLLKQQDKKVLIIEKQSLETKNKLCGGLLTQKSYDLLKEIFGENDIKKLITNNYTNGTIINNNKSFTINNINTYSVYRKKLDDYVVNKYISIGGDILDKTTYTSIDLNKNIITINNEEYSYLNIVGADGVFSQLRKNITQKAQKKNFALELHNTNNQYDSINIFFFNNFKGYGWIIPNNDYNMIGIGNVSNISKIDTDFNSFITSIDIKDINNKRGAFLPAGNDILLVRNNVFFIGDSAGLISPITGEGIYYAVYSAYLLSKDFSNYSKNMKTAIKEIKRDLFYMNFVYNDKIRNYLFSKYNKSPFITKLINRFAKHIL